MQDRRTLSSPSWQRERKEDRMKRIKNIVHCTIIQLREKACCRKAAGQQQGSSRTAAGHQQDSSRTAAGQQQKKAAGQQQNSSRTAAGQ